MSQTQLSAKYNAKAYEEIKVRVKKGEKEKIMAHAKEHDGSLNKFLNRAVKETIKRDCDSD